MGTLHSFRKEVAKNSMKFMPDMYTHPLGSLVISTCILTGDKYNTVDVNKQWRKICKKPEKYVDFWLDDPNFIDKSLKLFGMEKPECFPIAMVQSDFNVLFMPYVDGQLYPLREDGTFTQTAYKGKIYPIDFTNKDSGEVTVKKEED